jgi:hypothetical protein
MVGQDVEGVLGGEGEEPLGENRRGSGSEPIFSTSRAANSSPTQRSANSSISNRDSGRPTTLRRPPAAGSS